jgi:hypothetical protein
VGYVGSQGHHLFSKTTANGFLPKTTTRPIPSLGSYGLKSNNGNDNFNALQVSLQRTFKNGFLWQTQYMWGHAITDASIGAGEAVSVENNSCLSCDRSSTNQDVRHTITTNAVYQLPFGQGRRFLNEGVVGKIAGGWDLSGIGTARSGLPVNITITRKANVMQDGITSGQRPDLLPGVSIYPDGGSTRRSLGALPEALSTPSPRAVLTTSMESHISQIVTMTGARTTPTRPTPLTLQRRLRPTLLPFLTSQKTGARSGALTREAH